MNKTIWGLIVLSLVNTVLVIIALSAANAAESQHATMCNTGSAVMSANQLRSIGC